MNLCAWVIHLYTFGLARKSRVAGRRNRGEYTPDLFSQPAHVARPGPRPGGKAGTAIQFQKRELVAVPVLRRRALPGRRVPTIALALRPLAISETIAA